MVSSPTAATLYPQVDFAEDPGLRDLPRLFDQDWVWRAYHRQFGRHETEPFRIRIRQFAHSLGRVAIVSYEMEWRPDDYIPSQHFAVKIERDKPIELFRYPNDSRLPGLSEVAHPETALELLNKHVLAVRARRVSVQLIRYRPASRAVLRHSAGRARFFVRVMRPNTLAPLLAAHRLIGRSGFVAPRIAGHWAEGGVVWLSEIPGRNLRRQIRRGRLPDASLLLDGLESLWSAKPEGEGGRPFNLAGAYRRAKRSFRHNVRGGPALQSLNDAIGALEPFVRSWRPAGIAHNDFYDDQMLALRDGRIALVDFEESGPGDPMLDVGNFLAHLKWASCFGRSRGRADGSGAYYRLFRRAALERLGWNEDALAFREAVCLFRICTNTIRRPQSDWRDRLEAGLFLVNETLG